METNDFTAVGKPIDYTQGQTERGITKVWARIVSLIVVDRLHSDTPVQVCTMPVADETFQRTSDGTVVVVQGERICS